MSMPQEGQAVGAPGEVNSLERLVEQLAAIVTRATAIVCAGNDLYGDDGAGPVVAGKLAGTVPWEVFDAQTAPESFLMRIAAGRPDVVILVDAVDFGASPGTVRLVAPESIANQGPSTHGPAPVAFLEALTLIHPCRTVVLGIQPGDAGLDKPLSEPVARAVEMVVEAFRRAAGTGDGPRP